MCKENYSEDMKKFNEMTKPMRFRKLKMISQSVGLTYEVGKERISYLFNNILYKLHIYKRYNYRDNVVTNYDIPEITLKRKRVVTRNFDVLVDMKFEWIEEIDLDYFYRELKDGHKKITHYMKNESTGRLFAVANLDDICLIIDGKKYNVNNLPVFKFRTITQKPQGFSDTPIVNDLVDYRTVTYDVFPLKQTTHKTLVAFGMKPDGITDSIVNYFYSVSRRYFEEQLNDLTLEALIRWED